MAWSSFRMVYNNLLSRRTETSGPIMCWLLMAGHMGRLLDTRLQDATVFLGKQHMFLKRQHTVPVNIS